MIPISKYLWKRLVIPLALFSLFFALFALTIPSENPWQGICANLAVTFIGILLTVMYVDYILKQQEKGRWAGAKSLINRRIERFAIVASTQFRLAFGYSSDIYKRDIDMNDPLIRRKEIIRINENILLPSLNNKIQKLDHADWKKLAKQLQLYWEGGEKLYEVFGNRIDPEIVTSILGIQDEIESILILYSTWPDIIGVPDEKLPFSTKTDLRKNKSALENLISEHVNKILRLSSQLLLKLEE